MEEKRRDSAGTPPPATLSDAQASDQPPSRRRGGSLKRKLTSVSGGGGSSSLTPLMASSKRQAREKPLAVPFPPIQMNGPCTRARVHPHNSISFGEVAPVKGEMEVAAKVEDLSRVSEDLEALESKIEAEYEAIRERDANVHVVPVHAGWFMWTEIHPLEEKMLPSFFDGKSDSRNPEIYMAIRNWIMKKFHFNPNEQIELKHLPELTVGELDAQQEVMEFLDYWGLINFHPFPHSESAATTVNVDAEMSEAGEMDLLIEKLFKFETVQSWTPVSPRMNREIPTMPSGLFPEYVADELVKPEGPNVEYHCNSCSADCSRKRYHCQKQADFDLCADCFNNGKFGSDMSPSDFILMEPAEAAGASVGNWTDQETLLLLEAIELFRDNWSEIAEHVATKTKAQCILHFVQMPIEDAFFSHEDETDSAQENAVQVTNNTDNSAPRDNDTPDKDVAENTEGQDGSTDNQDSSPMEISNPEEVKEPENSLEVGEGFVLKALREAFEAVGSFPAPGERLSFADASNPVMALAAFLVRLVDPNIATASIQSLLKLVSGNCSSEQLAARQCLPLEDPPDDEKNLSNSDGAATMTVEHKARKVQDENAEKPEKAPISSVGRTSFHDSESSVSKDSTVEDRGKRDSALEEQKPGASLRTDETDGTDTAKEDKGVSARQKPLQASENEPSNFDIPQEQAEKDIKVVVSLKELENGTSAGDTSQSSESTRGEERISISEKKEGDLLPRVNAMTEKEDNTGDGDAKESSSEKKETLLKKKDFDIRKLKRAAVTALSAAAVKAKLLAEQEEDQILRLSTFLIEKELYKLETKLAFFHDLENVVIRVKEHIDKSKLRLFHERAQIIAARIGNRPTPQGLPPNRGAVNNFQNTTSRPFMGVNSLRPPLSRPMPSPSGNPASLVSVPGNSLQPSVEQLSSFGMK